MDRDPRHDPVAELLARFQASGDEDALDALLRAEVATLRERVRRRYGHLLTPTKTASDVAQEAAIGWLKVRQRTAFENPTALRAYLLRAAFRLLARHAGRRAARPLKVRADDAPEPADVAASPDDALGDAESRNLLHLALETMPAATRDLLEDVYFRERDAREIAADLGIEFEAAHKRIQRARKALAERLAAWSRVVTP